MGLLVAGVHEGAAGALGVEIGIVEGRAGLVGGEAAGEQGIGLEFGRAAVELAGVAEDHSGAAMHGLDDAADLDVKVAIFAEFANVVAVFPEADEGEAAGIVRGLRGADIEKNGAIGELDDIVDVGGDADVLVEHFGGLIGGDAGLLPGGGGGEWDRQGEQDEPVRGAHAHKGSLRKAGRMVAPIFGCGKLAVQSKVCGTGVCRTAFMK